MLVIENIWVLLQLWYIYLFFCSWICPVVVSLRYRLWLKTWLPAWSLTSICTTWACTRTCLCDSWPRRSASWRWTSAPSTGSRATGRRANSLWRYEAAWHTSHIHTMPSGRSPLLRDVWTEKLCAWRVCACLFIRLVNCKLMLRGCTRLTPTTSRASESNCATWRTPSSRVKQSPVTSEVSRTFSSFRLNKINAGPHMFSLCLCKK